MRAALAETEQAAKREAEARAAAEAELQASAAREALLRETAESERTARASVVQSSEARLAAERAEQQRLLDARSTELAEAMRSIAELKQMFEQKGEARASAVLISLLETAREYEAIPPLPPTSSSACPDLARGNQRRELDAQ